MCGMMKKCSFEKLCKVYVAIEMRLDTLNRLTNSSITFASIFNRIHHQLQVRCFKQKYFKIIVVAKLTTDDDR